VTLLLQSGQFWGESHGAPAGSVSVDCPEASPSFFSYDRMLESFTPAIREKSLQFWIPIRELRTLRG
jgi:hypothetical protein